MGMTLERCEAVNRASHLALVFSSLKALGVTDRDAFNDITHEVLWSNRAHLACGRYGERNALDSRNRSDARTPGTAPIGGGGQSNEEIDLILGIGAHTVKNQLAKIVRRLAIENRYAAAVATRGDMRMRKSFVLRQIGCPGRMLRSCRNRKISVRTLNWESLH
jgi:hypothetical protein